MPSRIRVLRTIGAVALLAVTSAASGQMYKCVDKTGKTTYGDAPCDAAAQPLKLPPDTKGNSTNPNTCAQLLDETRRLDAEADRDTKRGRAETADHAKQRQTMAKRYGERCAGISRSGATPG
jgi:Domain of unknown function (DUF4124)